MADLKISQLTDGGASQAADEYVVARSGSNFRIDGASVAAAATSVGTLSSLTVSGNTILGQEVFRNIDNGILRIAGGNPAATGAQMLLSGSTHASVPGRLYLEATGTGSFIARTGGADRLTVDSSGNLAVDTNTLYVDAANNRVGIGTASPLEALHVVSGAAIVAGSLSSLNRPQSSAMDKLGNVSRFFSIGADASTNGSFEWHRSTTTTNTVAMTLDASGNLGLGVTPSAWSSLFKVQQIAAQSAFWGSSSATYISTNNYNDGSDKYIGTGNASRYYQFNGAHVWQTAASGTAGNAISFTQAMTLSASGILSVTATSGTGGQINLFGDAQTTGEVTLGQGFSLATDDIGYLYNRSNAAFVFGTNNTERARITSDGVFQVTTSGTNTRIATKATSVGTAATTISFVTSGFGQIVTVNGIDASTGNIFTDLIFTSETAGPTVLSAKTISGAPAGRTYTMGGGAGTDLRLAMASGTYDVRCVQYLGV